MPKSSLLASINARPAVHNGELVTAATVVQVSQLAMTAPYSGDFQIIDNGRLIVGEHPDLGDRVVVGKFGLFGYDPDGVNTFAVLSKQYGPWGSGDVFAGYVSGNYLHFDQSAGTLGVYSPAGAGFIAAADGSLYAGDADGAHMRWNTATRAVEVRNGDDVKISLDANGDAMFDGMVYAQGGRIYGQMQVDGLFRAGDVDGPSVSLGRFERLVGETLVESGEIIATDDKNMPWFHVTAGGSTANGGWFHLGGTGDYPQRLTYDGADLVFDGTLYARGGSFSGDMTVGGDLTITTGSITTTSVVVDNNGITFDAITGRYDGAGLKWATGATEYLRIGTQVDLGAVTGTIIENPTAGGTLTLSAGNIKVDADAVTVTSSATQIGAPGTNYTQFDATGHLTFAGTAKPWNDMLIEPVARTAGTNAPTFEKWYDDAGGTSRGVYLYSFDDAAAGSEKEVFFNMQMSHAWDGGNIYFHVHWVGAVDDTTATPRWGLEYVWREPGGTYSDTTIVYATGNHLSEADITANKHYITAFTALSPGSTADDLSSVLIGRLFRDSANAADTYNATGAKCGLLYIDAHYQLARIGSNDEYSA